MRKAMAITEELCDQSFSSSAVSQIALLLAVDLGQLTWLSTVREEPRGTGQCARSPLGKVDSICLRASAPDSDGAGLTYNRRETLQRFRP